jgi:hypothetical protein
MGDYGIVFFVTEGGDMISVNGVSLQPVDVDELPSSMTNLRQIMILKKGRDTAVKKHKGFFWRVVCMLFIYSVLASLLLVVVPDPFHKILPVVFFAGNVISLFVMSQLLASGRKMTAPVGTLKEEYGSRLPFLTVFLVLTFPVLILVLLFIDKIALNRDFPDLTHDPRRECFTMFFERVGKWNELLRLVHSRNEHGCRHVKDLDWLRKLSEFEPELRACAMKMHGHLCLQPAHQAPIMIPESIRILQEEITEWSSRLIVHVNEKSCISTELDRQEKEKQNVA